jgi:hypothetical protein
MSTATVNPDIQEIDEKIQALRDQISDLERIKETAEQEGDPHRDRMVVDLGDGDYQATHRWEIKPSNGWVTVQLVDGSILPTRMGKWCLYSYATDFFSIERSQIKIDDPQ